jgi:hypothetical protein
MIKIAARSIHLVFYWHFEAGQKGLERVLLKQAILTTSIL